MAAERALSMPMTRCSPPAACTLRSPCNGTRCQVLRHACVFNETVVHRDKAGSWRVLRAKIRKPWISHELMSYESLNADTKINAAVLDAANFRDMSCAPPLAWVPVWSHNFADTFHSTIVPLLELEWLGVVRPNQTLLLVDTLHKHIGRRCRSSTNGPCATPAWFSLAVGHVSRLELVHQIAPSRCQGADRSCTPVCFSHLRFCSLRSMFDRMPRRLDVWSTAQTLVRRVLPSLEPSSAAAHGALSWTGERRLRLLFERRMVRGFRGRAIGNLDQLIRLCAREKRLECREVTFGVQGLAADVEAVRWADVLIGLHGAGLTHAFFMRRRSTLVEIRPYGFDGGCMRLALDPIQL